jgi:hypothetical protein
LYNGLAHYEEAAAAAGQATSNPLDPWIPGWALPELVEAAAREQNAECARDALKRLAETTQACGNDFALGVEARCRALLSDGTAAENLYCEAIDRLTSTRLRTELARAHLLYGEWLRREGRRVDAREATAHCLQHVRRHRDGGVRRTCTPRADRDRRKRAKAPRRHA